MQRSVQRGASGGPPHALHNHTAAILEIGTNLLTHAAEQSRRLSAVEAQVSPVRPRSSRVPR